MHFCLTPGRMNHLCSRARWTMKSDILKSSRSLVKPVRAHYSSPLTTADHSGAGKSTLIKLLIEFAEHQQNPGEQLRFRTPIVGPREATDPTSADVRMYADPHTFWSTKPILYADCEGLHGGEHRPRGARREEEGLQPYSISGANMWPLAWARTHEKCKRSYTVAELYPRLLYTFSDVVVFVTTNRR